MSYPVIIKYQYDPNNITLVKTYHDTDKNIYYYKIVYIYPSTISHEMYFVTDYMKIKSMGHSFFVDKHKSTDDDTKASIDFTIIVESIKNDIQKQINKEFGHDIEIVLKNYNDNGCYINLKQNDKIMTSIINIHKSKAKGGGMTSLQNIAISEMYKRISKELPIHPKNDELSHMGKFVVKFKISVVPASKKCYVYLEALKAELKYNLSHCESIIDNNISLVHKTSGQNVTSICI